MVLDSRIKKVKRHFGIQKMDDWKNVEPAHILAIDGVGPVTLDHCRMYLAARGITLRDDGTPDYWNKHFAEMKIGGTMAILDVAVTAPFTILIDSKEQLPFTFQGLFCDSDQNGRPLVVPTRWQDLGESMGDYSIEGMEGDCHIERKSMDDAHGTFLGWGDRRERFERELENLAGMPCAAVVIECSLGVLIANAPSRGKKTKEENAKILHRQMMAWQQDYRIPWYFCDDRRLAEVTAFRILERYWKKHHRQKKPVDLKELDEVIASL